MLPFNNIKVKQDFFSPILTSQILNLVLRIFQLNKIFDIIGLKFTIVWYLFSICLFCCFFPLLTFYLFPLLDHYTLDWIVVGHNPWSPEESNTTEQLNNNGNITVGRFNFSYDVNYSSTSVTSINVSSPICVMKNNSVIYI